MLRQVADRWLDPRNPMVMITSWNEWNEDTGIEPLAGAEATAADTATDGISRTNGVAYGGVGTRYLEVVRNHYVAVAGRVVSSAGAPIDGTGVTAWRDGAAVAQAARRSVVQGQSVLPSVHLGVRGSIKKKNNKTQKTY